MEQNDALPGFCVSVIPVAGSSINLSIAILDSAWFIRTSCDGDMRIIRRNI